MYVVRNVLCKPYFLSSANSTSSVLCAQAAFDVELVEPCERQQEAAEALKAEVSLLDNPEKAGQELEEFVKFSADVKEKRRRISAAADWAGRCVCVRACVHACVHACVCACI